MATVIDIVNASLSNLGNSTNVTAIDPPDGSEEAALASRFYPIARDLMLSQHLWTFATKRSTLALLSATPPTGWDYAYQLPSDFILDGGVFGVETDIVHYQDGEPHVIEGTSIFSNTLQAEMRYVYIEGNTTLYSAKFTDSIIWMLASYMAGKLTQDLKLAEYCEVRAYRMLGMAKNEDASTQKVYTRNAIDMAYPIGFRSRG